MKNGRFLKEEKEEREREREKEEEAEREKKRKKEEGRRKRRTKGLVHSLNYDFRTPSKRSRDGLERVLMRL